MGIDRAIVAERRATHKISGTAMARWARSREWDFVGIENGSTMEGYSGAISFVSDMPSAISGVVPDGLICMDFAGNSKGFGRAREAGFIGMFY